MRANNCECYALLLRPRVFTTLVAWRHRPGVAGKPLGLGVVAA
jgi:hypothetical protein